MSYTVQWQRVLSLVEAAGIGVSFLVWHPGPALVGLTVSVLCAGTLLGLASANGPTAVDWSRVTSQALLLGAGLVAFSALSVLSPPIALALLLVVGATAPWVVHWAAARLVEPASAAAPGPQVACQDRLPLEGLQPEPTPGVRPDLTARTVRMLTNDELCRAWRHSFLGLQSARSPQELLAVVTVRQLCLDELERRSPSALGAWLSSGARAAGGPDRFLGGEPRDGRSDAA